MNSAVAVPSSPKGEGPKGPRRYKPHVSLATYKEISRIVVTADLRFDFELIRHVSLIEWTNVILYGEIQIDPARLRIHSF